MVFDGVCGCQCVDMCVGLLGVLFVWLWMSVFVSVGAFGTVHVVCLFRFLHFFVICVIDFYFRSFVHDFSSCVFFILLFLFVMFFSCNCNQKSVAISFLVQFNFSMFKFQIWCVTSNF